MGSPPNGVAAMFTLLYCSHMNGCPLSRLLVIGAISGSVASGHALLLRQEQATPD
jgi:hypothetical protein